MQRLLFTLRLCGNSSTFNLVYGNSIVTILARVKNKKCYSSCDKHKILIMQEGLTVVEI